MEAREFAKLFKVLEELMLRSNEIDTNQMQAQLRELGITKSELLEEARFFLRNLKESEDFPESSLIEAARDLLKTGFGLSELPEHIGNYEILDLIEEGGMGCVYLGFQREPVPRKVAVKVLKRENPAQVLRFHLEAKVLARVDHPNVARILEMGETGQNKPFIIMEYFPGEFITTFCNRKSLSVSQRISLFLEVCDGIAHIHRKGILHRDIKPSNILVLNRDHQVLTKIIDFGIAREMTTPIGEATLESGPGTIVGTLAYMSPEQTKGASTDLDVRSDIYSAAAVLYEMLTGVPPLDPKKLSTLPIDQTFRIIREEETMPPSKRVLLEKIGSADKGTQLSKSFHGEIDWILCKALSKDPEHRYDSIGGFAADLKRYLQGKPVSAGPISGFYRTRKYLRRHLFAVMTSIIFLFLLVGTTVVSTWSLIQARKSRDRAMLESSKSQALFNIFTQVLSSPNPYVQDKDIRLVDTLDEVARQAERAYQDYPEIRLDVHHTLGQTYQGLGQHDKGERHYRLALDLSRSLYGPNHTGTLNLRYKLAEILLLDRRLDLAERELFELQAQVKSLPSGHRLQFLTGKLAAHLLRETGRLNEARAVYDRLLNDPSPLDVDYLDALRGLGITERKVGHLNRALECYKKVLSLQNDLGTPRGHHERLHTLNNLANIYSELGELAQAEELYRDILKTRIDTLGEKHPSTIISLHNLGTHLMAAKKFEESLFILERAGLFFEEIRGTYHRHTLTARNNLGRVLLKMDRYAEAEEHYGKWYPLAAEHLGSHDDLSLMMGHNLGIAFLEQMEWKRARNILEDILFKRETRFGGQHADTILTRFVLGRISLGENKTDEAVFHFRRAWQDAGAFLPNRPELEGLYQSFLGSALFKDGQKEEGERHLRQGYSQLPEGPSAERERVEILFREAGLSPNQKKDMH